MVTSAQNNLQSDGVDEGNHVDGDEGNCNNLPSHHVYVLQWVTEENVAFESNEGDMMRLPKNNTSHNC